MSSDLYFIPLIARAVRQRAPKDALRRAFADIAARGQQPECENGFWQFLQFMAVAAERLDRIEEVKLRRAIIELAAGCDSAALTDTDVTLQIIRKSLRWEIEYKQRLAEMERSSEPTGFDVQLLDVDETPRGRVHLERDTPYGMIGNVAPGEYEVALNAGWIIWQGSLTDRDLIWAMAFPGRPLSLAADTGKPAGQPSRQLDLLDGELAMRIFPGVETGRIELQWRRTGGEERED